MGGGRFSSPLLVLPCSTSAPIICYLLSRTEYPSCAVFLLRDLDTQRVYRLHDFTKALLIRPDVAYCVAGKVNSADKLYLVIEIGPAGRQTPAVLHGSCSC
jgi:hypothetical protein